MSQISIGFVKAGFHLTGGYTDLSVVSGFLTKGICLRIVTESVYLWGEEESRASYSAILPTSSLQKFGGFF